jgi:hypothetical protein
MTFILIPANRCGRCLMRRFQQWCQICGRSTMHKTRTHPPRLAWPWALIWPFLWAIHRATDPPVCLSCHERWLREKIADMSVGNLGDRSRKRRCPDPSRGEAGAKSNDLQQDVAGQAPRHG